MKITRSLIVGSSTVVALVWLRNALVGSLRVLSEIEPHKNDGQSLLLPYHADDTISYYDTIVGVVEDDPYLTTMMSDTRLVRSAQQQSKFLSRRKAINDTLHMFFPRNVLFPTTITWWAAFTINEEWGYVRKQ
jgi:hypothetical protein